MINFDYNIYSLVKNIPYMDNSDKNDIIKYIDDFSSCDENFYYDKKIIVDKIINLKKGIYLFETDFELKTEEIKINMYTPSDSKSYTAYTRNCERGLIISNTLADAIFTCLPKILIFENNSYYKSTSCSSFIRLISYDNPKQKFVSHRDGYFIKKSNNNIKTFYTFIIYLNNVENGGETDFPFLNIKIKPKKGNILIFPHSEVHRGLDIISDKKKILRGDIVFEKN